MPARAERIKLVLAWQCAEAARVEAGAVELDDAVVTQGDGAPLSCDAPRVHAVGRW